MSTQKKPVQPQDKFVVRFPEGLRDRIAQEAAIAGRSMNAEIVVRLESSFRHGIVPERAPATASNPVYLRPFQQWLMECMRKLVRIEALMGASSLTREQKAELSRLKQELEEAMVTPDNLDLTLPKTRAGDAAF